MNLLITDELTLARSHSNAPTEFSGHSSHNYIPFVNTYKWLVVNYSLIVQYSDLTVVFIQENSHTNMEKASPRLEITFLMCTKVRNNKNMNIAVKCSLAPYSNTFRTVTITSIHIVGQVLQVWITWKFISKKFVKNSKGLNPSPKAVAASSKDHLRNSIKAAARSKNHLRNSIRTSSRPARHSQ